MGHFVKRHFILFVWILAFLMVFAFGVGVDIGLDLEDPMQNPIYEASIIISSILLLLSCPILIVDTVVSIRIKKKEPNDKFDSNGVPLPTVSSALPPSLSEKPLESPSAPLGSANNFNQADTALYCPLCGAEHDRKTTYCKQCGNKLK